MVIAAASMYVPAIAGLVRQWYEDPSASYAFIVIVAAAIAFRERWPRLRAHEPQASRWGAAALALSCVFYLVAALAADIFLVRFSLLALAVASAWFVWGSARVRVMAAPLLLLLLAIPLPSALVTELTMPLQLAASRCAELMLGAAGVPVVRDGNVLTLNYITLEVAEACSGMRSLVTLVALVGVYAVMFHATPRRTLLLAAVAVPVAIAGNGLRVAFTAMLASRMGNDAVQGLVHEATGWGAFVIMCAGLVLVHALASRCARTLRAAA